MSKTSISCRCGNVELEVPDKVVMSNACLCDSCRRAAEIFAELPNGIDVSDEKGASHVLIYRVDKVACRRGSDHLKQHRLTPHSTTRRIVASCCNTPMFLDFEPGPWLSLYAVNWPKDTRPPVQFRTFCNDLPDMSVLPRDVPNGKPVPFGVVWRMLWMGISLGFRPPKVTFVQGELDV